MTENTIPNKEQIISLIIEKDLKQIQDDDIRHFIEQRLKDGNPPSTEEVLSFGREKGVSNENLNQSIKAYRSVRERNRNIFNNEEISPLPVSAEEKTEQPLESLNELATKPIEVSKEIREKLTKLKSLLKSYFNKNERYIIHIVHTHITLTKDNYEEFAEDPISKLNYNVDYLKTPKFKTLFETTLDKEINLLRDLLISGTESQNQPKATEEKSHLEAYKQEAKRTLKKILKLSNEPIITIGNLEILETNIDAVITAWVGTPPGNPPLTLVTKIAELKRQYFGEIDDAYVLAYLSTKDENPITDRRKTYRLLVNNLNFSIDSDEDLKNGIDGTIETISTDLLPDNDLDAFLAREHESLTEVNITTPLTETDTPKGGLQARNKLVLAINFLVRQSSNNEITSTLRNQARQKLQEFIELYNDLPKHEKFLSEERREVASPEPEENDRMDENDNNDMEQTSPEQLKQNAINQLIAILKYKLQDGLYAIRLTIPTRGVIEVNRQNLEDDDVRVGTPSLESIIKQNLDLDNVDVDTIHSLTAQVSNGGQDVEFVTARPSDNNDQQDEAPTEAQTTDQRNSHQTENQPVAQATAGTRGDRLREAAANIRAEQRNEDNTNRDEPEPQSPARRIINALRQPGVTRNRSRRAANPNDIPTTPDTPTPNTQDENGRAPTQPEAQATISTPGEVATQLGMTIDEFNQVQINQPEDAQNNQQETLSEQEQLQQTIGQRSIVLTSLREQIAAVREGRTQATNERAKELIETYQRTATLLAQAETNLANYELTRQNLNGQMDTILGVEQDEQTTDNEESAIGQPSENWWTRLRNRFRRNRQPESAETSTATPVATATPQAAEAGNGGTPPTPPTAESGTAPEGGGNERPRGFRGRLRNWWNTTNKLAYASGALIGAASTAALASWLPIPGVPAVVKTVAIAGIAQAWNAWLKRSNEKAFNAEDVQRLERNEKWNKNFRDAVAGIAAGSTTVAAFSLADWAGGQFSNVIDIDFENTMTNEGRLSINWAGDEPNSAETIWETNWNNTTEMSPETADDPFNTTIPDAANAEPQIDSNFGSGNGDPSTNGLIDTTTNSTILNSGVQSGAQSGNPTTTEPGGGIFENVQETIANTFDNTDPAEQPSLQTGEPQPSGQGNQVGTMVLEDNVTQSMQQAPAEPTEPVDPDALQQAADADPIPQDPDNIPSANYSETVDTMSATAEPASESGTTVTLTESNNTTTLEVPEQPTTTNETTTADGQPVESTASAETVNPQETAPTTLETATEAVEDITENFTEKWQRLNSNVQILSQNAINWITNLWQNGFTGGSFGEYLGEGVDFNNPEAVNTAINNMQIGNQGEALVYINDGRLHGLTPSEWNYNFPGPGGQDSVVFGLERGFGDDRTIFSIIGTIEDKLSSEDISLNEFFNSIDTEAERAAFSSELSQSVNTARNTIGLDNITPQNINNFASNILTAVNNASN